MGLELWWGRGGMGDLHSPVGVTSAASVGKEEKERGKGEGEGAK